MRHQTVTGPPGPATGVMMRVDDLLIVDDHPLMCEALTVTLRVAFGLRQTACERNLAAAIQRLASRQAMGKLVVMPGLGS